MEKKNLFFFLEKRKPIRPEKNNLFFWEKIFCEKFLWEFFSRGKKYFAEYFFFVANKKLFSSRKLFFLRRKKTPEKIKIIFIFFSETEKVFQTLFSEWRVYTRRFAGTRVLCTKCTILGGSFWDPFWGSKWGPECEKVVEFFFTCKTAKGQ